MPDGTLYVGTTEATRTNATHIVRDPQTWRGLCGKRIAEAWPAEGYDGVTCRACLRIVEGA